jgi:hypothetical protein
VVRLHLVITACDGQRWTDRSCSAAAVRAVLGNKEVYGTMANALTAASAPTPLV